MSDIRSQISILYAEDDLSVRRHFAALLSARGYIVRAVRNGADAVADFQQRRSDLVILDVMMPVMGGREACAAIRSVDSEVPILFHTALSGEEDELSGLKLGADDYVTKNASSELFLARVSAAARRARRPVSAGFLFGFGRVNPDDSTFSDGTVSSRLSVREVELLRLLFENQNRILTKDFLQTRLFGIDYSGDLRSFDKTLERMKGKLGASAAFVVTVPRQGIEYCPPK